MKINLRIVFFRLKACGAGFAPFRFCYGAFIGLCAFMHRTVQVSEGRFVLKQSEVRRK